MTFCIYPEIVLNIQVIENKSWIVSNIKVTKLICYLFSPRSNSDGVECKFVFGTGTSIKGGEVKISLCPKPPLVVKWCGDASVFHMRVKYQPSHITGWEVLFRKNAVSQSWPLY